MDYRVTNRGFVTECTSRAGQTEDKRQGRLELELGPSQALLGPWSLPMLTPPCYTPPPGRRNNIDVYMCSV